jgi:very-short-patch-repair endonuclease
MIIMTDLERQFLFQIRAYELPEPFMEYRFNHERRWRFDFAWPDQMLAVEIEGGSWTRGRHTRGAGFRNDCEKYNAAGKAGWTVLRFTCDMVEDGFAIDYLKDVIKKS